MSSSTAMETIHITDVAPRDGLQNQQVRVDAAFKLELIRKLAAAGLRSIEVGAFVSPKAVPQMADTAEIVRKLNELQRGSHEQPGLRTSVLVPNLRGLELAKDAGADEIAVVLSATETMNRKNINMSLQQALEVSVATLHAASAHGMRTRAYVAVAFDCPFEGETPTDRVVDLARQMKDAGAQEIVIADTIGSASPGMVKERMHALAQAVSLEKLAVHFHDTRGMGVANAWAALEAGVRRFDASVGGIGGCPFAPGAAGNLATEDLVLMAERSGFQTGIQIDKLLDAVDIAEAALQRPLGGRSIAWLRRQKERA